MRENTRIQMVNSNDIDQNDRCSQTLESCKKSKIPQAAVIDRAIPYLQNPSNQILNPKGVGNVRQMPVVLLLSIAVRISEFSVFVCYKESWRSNASGGSKVKR